MKYFLLLFQMMVFSLKNNNRCTNIMLMIFRCKCFTICVSVMFALSSVRSGVCLIFFPCVVSDVDDVYSDVGHFPPVRIYAQILC